MWNFAAVAVRKIFPSAVSLRRSHLSQPVYWGGLSGSPYSEAVSWGKFVPTEEGGRLAELFLDATVGLPLVAEAVLERLGKK